MTTTTFSVPMTCGGCSGACTKILNKIEGVTQVVPDLEAKVILVTHTAEASTEEMLAGLRNWAVKAKKEDVPAIVSSSAA